MSRLRFVYYMKLAFSDSVSNHRFSLKCIPQSDERQHIHITHKDIYPNSFISEGRDSFGNIIIYGFEEETHKHFFFDIEGEAEVGDFTVNNVDAESRLSFYKYQTKVTSPGEAIRTYYDDVLAHYKDESDKMFCTYGSILTNDTTAFAVYVMHRLGMDYKYMPGVTDILTKAEDAMICKEGVCQDYAHIMISLLRMKKIPCRYVTGMMLGEGKSHAWVEVYSDGMWIGIDPTNSQLVDDFYIKIAHGRDYSDCLVNQGIFTGNVTQIQEISVNVEEVK